MARTILAKMPNYVRRYVFVVTIKHANYSKNLC